MSPSQHQVEGIQGYQYGSIEVASAERIIRDHVLRRYENQAHQGEDWRDLAEIPTSSEIMPVEEQSASKDFFEAWDAYQDEPLYNPALPKNIIKGPWPSKEDYIGAHYQILREDSVAGLRSSVKSYKRLPEMVDDQFTHVYTHVHFKGFVLSDMGAAFRIEFSHERAGKQIRWKQSSRLQQGTMVALSPMTDSFRSVCKIAIVAARPIEGGLDCNPPQIDIFWGDLDDAVFDPVEPYVMLEARGAYFEASRHMLVALQKLRTEQFRLSKHLVDLDPNIGVPDWLEEQRLLDLTSLIQDIVPTAQAEEVVALYNADILQGFPKISSSGMDESQIRACERMVTKKVSIVQGPPGTGKTFTSVSALRVLIENMDKNSPPIIIAAQTNHALDQLMNHILGFEPNVLRLGGRSDKENVEILKRTLYMLRSTTRDVPNGYKGMKSAKFMLESKQTEIQETVNPLVSETILSDETLLKAGIITEAQKDSLYDDEGWATSENTKESASHPSRFEQWVGSANLVPMPHAPLINMGLPLEESDLEYEQLQEVEQETEGLPADKDIDALRGVIIAFGRTTTGRCLPGHEDRKIKKLASKKDLHEIPAGMRGPVYRYWEKQLDKSILAKLKEQLRGYKSSTDDLRMVKWANNFRLIKHLGIKVVGCTTTGLSKYRGLLAALQPRILLIEEAAETLEGTVMAGMFESLEQLILVGDHQQLQAHANVRPLELEPYNLSISMFERLVNNSIPFTMLNQQRRMISDIRKLLCIEPEPFYRDLQDHPSVMDRTTNRPPIPGMGGKNTYFFHHNWSEDKATDMSRSNLGEAEMIVGFFYHLFLNGVAPPKITVLTFYNGQRKTILQLLKRHEELRHHLYFNVFTVDSYQGEENDVILLSLVRSNNHHNIGFLDNKNRLVVALSRARRGLYAFGNTATLMAQEMPYEDREAVVRDPMWSYLITHMRNTARCDIDGGLPITCANHGKTIRVHDPDQLGLLAGGCDEQCPDNLNCGHPCPYLCHPFEHSRVACKEPCTQVLNCGHRCSRECGEECFCLAAECKQANFSNLNLGNDQTRYDEETAWESPTKEGKNLDNSKSQPRDVTSSKKTPFKGQDFRKNNSVESIHRDISGPAPKRNYSAGNGIRKSGVVSGPRNSSSPSKAIDSSHPSISQWNTWDAKKADKEADDERRRRAEEGPKVDYSTWVYNDIHKAVKIVDGVRIKDPSSSTTTIIPRFDPTHLASLEQALSVSNSAPHDPAKALLTVPQKQTEFFAQSGPNHSPGMSEWGNAASETTTSCSLADLAGLDIGTPDPFGDFDQFEKQSG